MNGVRSLAPDRAAREEPGRLARSGGPFGGGDAQELVDAGELDAGSSGGLAEGALVAVDGFPAGVGDQVGLAGAKERLDGVGVGRGGGVGKHRGGGGGIFGIGSREVGENGVDCLLGVLLVGADDAGGAALDPADDVLAG